MNEYSSFFIPNKLETERLILRVLQPGDGRLLHEAAVESYAELHPWMEFAKNMPILADVENFAREAARMFLNRDEINFIVFRKSDGTVLGAMGIHHIDWDVPRFEIGYWVRTRLSGNGYVTEGVRAILDLLFETLSAERVEIRCDSRNSRSAAVAHRAGFKLEATLRRESRANDDSLRDTLVFAMLREDYQAVTGIADSAS